MQSGTPLDPDELDEDGTHAECGYLPGDPQHRIQCGEEGETIYQHDWEGDTCGMGGGTIRVIRLDGRFFVDDSGTGEFDGPCAFPAKELAADSGVFNVNSTTYHIFADDPDGDVQVSDLVLDVDDVDAPGHTFSLNGLDLAVGYYGSIVPGDQLPPQSPFGAWETICEGSGTRVHPPTVERSSELDGTPPGVFTLEGCEGFWVYRPDADDGDAGYHETLEAARAEFDSRAQ